MDTPVPVEFTVGLCLQLHVYAFAFSTEAHTLFFFFFTHTIQQARWWKSTNYILSHQMSALFAPPCLPLLFPCRETRRKTGVGGGGGERETAFLPVPLPRLLFPFFSFSLSLLSYSSNGNIMHILRRIKATGSNNRPILCVCDSRCVCLRAGRGESSGGKLRGMQSPTDG